MAKIVHWTILHLESSFGFPVLLKQLMIIVDSLLIIGMGIQKQIQIYQ